MDRCNLFRHRRVCTFRRSSSNKFLLPRLIRRSRSTRSHPSLFFPDLDTVKLDLTTTCAAMRGSRPITLLRLMLLMSRWAGGGDCFSPPFPYTLPRTVKIPFLRFSTRAHASSNVRIDSRFYRYLRIRDLIALSLTILFSMGYDLVGVSLKERCGARLFRSFPCSGAEHDRTAVR